MIKKIKFQVEQIDELLRVYARLFKDCREKKPELLEITALGSVLHSFYNGLENIFLLIAKEIDGAIPSGSQWHQELLLEMAKANTKRGKVISPPRREKLTAYLAFRHFYRHSYAFFLKWEDMQNLVLSLPEIWEQTKRELEQFLVKIEKRA